MRLASDVAVHISTLFGEGLNFTLPHELEAESPPEARGLGRDEVRLMVSSPNSGAITHCHFRDLPNFLRAGDVLAINTSATVNAALNAHRADGTPLEVHLSTQLPGDLTLIEAYQSTTSGKSLPVFALSY